MKCPTHKPNLNPFSKENFKKEMKLFKNTRNWSNRAEAIELKADKIR